MQRAVTMQRALQARNFLSLSSVDTLGRAMNPLIDRALQFLRVSHDVRAEPEYHRPNGTRYRVDKRLMTEDEILV
jgi:hypothetical protein